MTTSQNSAGVGPNPGFGRQPGKWANSCQERSKRMEQISFFSPDIFDAGVLAAFLCEVDFTLRWRQAEEASRNLQLQLFISFKFPCNPLQ